MTDDGKLYALEIPRHEWDQYVSVFNSDGSFKNKIKLDPGFHWEVSTLDVFSNGTLLVTGEKVKKTDPMLAFTGIFDSDGKLLKQVELEDDQAIDHMAEMRDSRVIPRSVLYNSNHAVAWGKPKRPKMATFM